MKKCKIRPRDGDRDLARLMSDLRQFVRDSNLSVREYARATRNQFAREQARRRRAETEENTILQKFW